MNNIQGRAKQAGFTIVELLIVIVVIAILASITIVAYGGISERARNTARLAAVRQAQQAVQLAIMSNSPSVVESTLYADGGWGACIGSGHKSLDGDVTPDCGAYGGDAYVSEVDEFNDLLRSAGSLPGMGTYPETTSDDGDVVSGPYLEEIDSVDSINRLVIEYSLEGEEQDCSMSPLVYGGSGSQTLTQPATGSEYSSTGNGVTECRFVVADLE